MRGHFASPTQSIAAQSARSLTAPIYILYNHSPRRLVPMDDLLADIKKLKAASNGGSSDG
eukprot:SAG31_NODE_1744_length_7379_cov_28.134753_3_plen_60_part_00